MAVDDETGGLHTRLVDVHTAVITLDRPHVRNAMDWNTWSDLGQSLDRVLSEPDIRAIVLTGADGCFSSGGDMSTLGRGGDGILGPGSRLRHAHEVLRDLYACPKPTVAAVEGFAIGVGWSLALACDFVICGRSAYFWAPFTTLGLVPDGGLAWMLARRTGHAAAASALYLGQKLDMNHPIAAALVTEVVDDDTAVEEAVQLASKLATVSPASVTLTKHLLRHAQETGYAEFLRSEDLAATLKMHDAEDRGE